MSGMMITINYDSDRPTVSARELHKFLEVDSQFSHWFERMAEYGFTIGVDYEVIAENGYNSKGGRPTTDYQLTVDMAKEICMIQRSEKGKQMRQYFIQLEKDWNSPEKVMARALKIADRRITQLRESNKQLAMQAEQDAPKIQFADAVSGSNDCILVGELAKLIQQSGVDIGQNRLFIWLRKNRYLMRNRNGNNVPTQRSMSMRLFRIKEKVISKGGGGSQIVPMPIVTAKGQQYFLNKFINKT
jgi:anti-repressor protein